MKYRNIFTIIFLASAIISLLEAQRGRFAGPGGPGLAKVSSFGSAGKIGPSPSSAPQTGFAGAGKMDSLASQGATMSSGFGFDKGPRDLGGLSSPGALDQTPSFAQERTSTTLDAPGLDTRGPAQEGLGAALGLSEQTGRDFGFKPKEMAPPADQTPASEASDFGFGPKDSELKVEPDLKRSPEDIAKDIKPSLEPEAFEKGDLPGKEPGLKTDDFKPGDLETSPPDQAKEQPGDIKQPPKIEPQQVEKLADKLQEPQTQEKALENIAQKTGKDIDKIKDDFKDAGQKLDPTKVSAKDNKFKKFINPKKLDTQKKILHKNFKGHPWKWWWKHNKQLFFTLFPIYYYSLYNYWPPIYYDYYSVYGYYPTAITYLQPIVSPYENQVCMRNCTKECLNHTEYGLDRCLNECKGRCR